MKVADRKLSGYRQARSDTAAATCWRGNATAHQPDRSRPNVVNHRLTVNLRGYTVQGVTANDPQTATQDVILNVEPSANYRPGQRFRGRKSVDHTIRHGVRSMLLSVVRRPDFDLPDLASLGQLQRDLDHALDLAVSNLRSQGHSWQAIAAACGVTRQAAHKRWGIYSSPDPA